MRTALCATIAALTSLIIDTGVSTAGQDSLMLQSSVRYHAAPPPAAGRRRPSGRSERYQTGDIILLQASDRDNPLDMTGGVVRIQSASTGYDSGEQRLVYEQDGRTLYYRWATATAKPAADYRVDVAVDFKDGSRKSQEIAIALRPVIVEETILHSTTELSLPFWGLGLSLSRRYRYDSRYGIYKGAMGYGWIHDYDTFLTEYTDASISFFDARTGRNGYYRPTAPGQYQSRPGDDSRLTRDPDGVFHLRLPNGDLWRFQNDLKPAFLQDPRGKRVTFEHGPQGRLTAVSDSSGQRISFTYDTSGRIVKATDSTGRSVSYAYDSLGNLEAFKDVAGQSTRYRYDGDHRLVEILFADGRSRSYEYGGDRRLSRVSDDQGVGALTFKYNLANLTSGERTVSDALGRTIRELSSGDGFLTEKHDALGSATEWEYDGVFRLTRFSDANGKSWGYASDIEKGQAETTDPLAYKTSIAFSPDDRQATAVIDGNGHETSFTYESGGELASKKYADGLTEQRRVTQEGSLQIEERTRRSGQTNRYVFDGRGFLLKKELYDGSTWTYAYDEQGHMTAASNPAGTIAMGYDALGRMVTMVYPGNRTFRYEYDERGRRKRMTTPDGDVLTYAFDEAGRLNKIARAGVGIATFEYNQATQRTRRTLVNGVITDYRYDTAGRLVGVTNRGGNTLISSWSYGLDPNGRRRSKVGPEGEEAYSYDTAGSLLAVTYADQSSEAFEYDAAGNRTAVTTGGARSPVSTNALNQYTVIGNGGLIHDLNGNLNQWQGIRYDYDPEDRLVHVSFPDGTAVAYTYDASGRLRSRTTASGTKFFLWDQWQIAIEEDAAQTTLRSYVWAARLDEPLLVREGPEELFYVHDALGSVTELTDANGQVVNRRRYRAFGAPTSGAAGNDPFMFTGAFYDRDAGLYYLRNRWYSPALGRFIQMDPIGLIGGVNLYAYVLNDPVDYTDPLGWCGGDGGFGGSGGGMPSGEEATQGLYGGNGNNLNEGIGNFLGTGIYNAGISPDFGLSFTAGWQITGLFDQPH